MRYRLFIVLLVLAVAVLPGCRKQEQPAESDTRGNATDRNPATGTTGTGQPASPANDTAVAATQLGTAGGTGTTGSASTTGTLAVTGTEDVHAASTETTSTIAAPGTTTEAVATPTGTSATVVTSTGTKTTKKSSGQPKQHKLQF